MHTRAGILGFQIALLAFAVAILNAAFEKYVNSQWPWARDFDLQLGRALAIISGGLLLIAIGPLRRLCAEMLAPRIPKGKTGEVALAVAMNWLVELGAVGAVVLTIYCVGGEARLARFIDEHTPHYANIDKALSPSHLVMFVFVAGLVAPIVEELVFRGFIYGTWRQAWGWVWAAIGSATVFGLFHGLVVPQFLSGMVMVVAMRRSGSMRTNIYAHALFNLLAWYPLLGQFVLPSNRSTGEIEVWWFHLVCLAVTIVVLPLYMWSARDAKLARRSDDFAPAIS